MEAYFNRQHHPQQALQPRAGYVALDGDQVIGYIAGHRTNRHGCQGEVQYLFVAPAYRRRGIATMLLRLLAEWFHEQDAQRVCVGVADDSPREAKPFVESVGATPLKKHWYAWEDIVAVLLAYIFMGWMYPLQPMGEAPGRCGTPQQIFETGNAVTTGSFVMFN